MQNYDKFYYKHGTRFIRDLISPIVWTANDIAYPRSSMLLWNNPTSIKMWPSRNIGYFHNVKKAIVYNIIRYTHDDIKGNPKERTVSAGKIIAKAKHVEPKFKYLAKANPITISSEIPVLFNMGVLNSGYRYTPHPITPYYVWENSLSTAVSLASAKKSGVNRHKFIFMDIPYRVPSRIDINKYMPALTRPGLKIFSDAALFNILELFRFVHKDHKDKSVIAKMLTPDEFKYVDIILTINNKICIINLELLASITDAYAIESKLTKYPSKTVFKLLYIYLNRIIEAAPIIGTGKMAGISGLVDNSSVSARDKGDVNINLEDIIDNEISDTDNVESLSVTDIKGDIDSAIDVMDMEDTVSDSIDQNMDTIDESPALTDNEALVSILTDLSDRKLLSKAARDGMIDTIKGQVVMPSPYDDGTKLSDMLSPEITELDIPNTDDKALDSVSILDKSMAKDTLGSSKRTYLRKTMRKDILSTMYSIQKAGVVVKEHVITHKKDVLDDTEIHKLSLQSTNGTKSTITVHIPVVHEDNTIRMSGNNYVMRAQRADVPLKKISNSIVSLNSYYGKLFISRNTYKKNDLGYWFVKQLLKLDSVDDKLKDIALVSVLEPDVTAPKDYGILSRYVKGFTYSGVVFNFEYSNRLVGLGDIDVTKIEKKGSVIVGHKGKSPIVMNNDNTISVLDKNNANIGTIYEFLGMDIAKAPIEYCNAKIYKEQIPVGILLSYYLGFKNVLKMLNSKYETIDTGKRVTLGTDKFRIVFEDITYVITRDFAEGDMILAGISSLIKYTKKITSISIETRSAFGAMFSAMGLPILYVNEIKLMENMFIDPITKQVLELFKMPTSFVGVLRKAVELLNDDSYKHPNSLEGSIIKGYERISGMLYLELVKSLRVDMNKSHFSKSKIEFNPYAVNTKISGDSTTVILDDLNPMSELKQSEDVTYLGSHGRKEETMSAETRVMHKSEIGVISESVKDSGAVGISAYMTAAPKLATTRGTFDKLDKKDGWASKLSTSAMLAPFGTMDDSKRLI